MMISKAKYLYVLTGFLILIANAGCSKPAPKQVLLNQGDELVKVFKIEHKSQDHKLLIQTNRLPANGSVKINVNGKTLEGSFTTSTADGDSQWYSYPVSKTHLQEINGVVVKNLIADPLSFKCDQIKEKNSACGIKRSKTKYRLTKLTVSPRIKLIPVNEAEF